MTFAIRRDDLSSDQTRTLLALHLAGMRADSPPEAVYALDASGLMSPDVTAWSAWHGERIASIGALKMLGAGCAEMKSMRTHPDFLRMGAASAILEHALAEARRRGVRRVSLETGHGTAFEPALALYRRHGFVDGKRFGDYRENGFNQFLHLELR